MQGIKGLFEAGGSDAVLIQEGKPCVLELQSSTELRSGSHKKSAGLGWGGAAAGAQCLGFQHTQQNPRNPRKNSTDLDGGSKPALTSWRRTMRGTVEKGKWEISALPKGRQHCCGQSKAQPNGQCTYLCP